MPGPVVLVYVFHGESRIFVTGCVSACCIERLQTVPEKTDVLPTYIMTHFLVDASVTGGI